MFDSISENLMKVVFEDALEKGFYGLINTDCSTINLNIALANMSRVKDDVKPVDFVAKVCPQQEETRTVVIERKTAPEKKVWVVDLEARIKPNKVLTILIVDDSESDRMFIQETASIEFDKIVIDEASDGRQAFKKVESAYYAGTKYDVIFMDMNMANYDGRDGISMIRNFERKNKVTKPITICAVSADEFEDSSLLDKYGVAFKIKKPVTLKVLRMILKRAINPTFYPPN